MAQNNKLLRIEELVLYFNTTHGPVQAVDGVNFELDSNRAVVILGESGCGKSSLAKAILRLLPRNAGTYSGTRVSGWQGCDAIERGGLPPERPLGIHLHGSAGRHERVESRDPRGRTGG